MTKVRVNWSPLDEGCSVKLFVVNNTAHNSLYVLAQDNREAMSIAYASNHVYFPEPKIAETYIRLAEEVRVPFGREMAKHWDAIQAAIESRLRGTVHLEDDHIAIGNETFAR